MRERLAAAFAKRDDPYAGADLATACRFGGALWFVGSIFTTALLPLVPPNDAIGNAGWAIAAVMVIGGVLLGVRMRHMGPDVNVNELLFYSYAAFASVAVLVWLSGGLGSAYGALYVLSALYTAAVHPPRRSSVCLGFFALLALSPLVYDHNALRRDQVDLVAQLIMWLMVALFAMALMVFVRSQRMGLKREGETARREARIDPLTGLLNRRAFDADLQLAIARARVSGEPLSVLVADLDDFKDFNDRFGHLEGDGVLKRVADALPVAVRRPDSAYRWGGDEFAVILPQADLPGAERVARRVESTVSAYAGPDGEEIGICCGVAELQPGQDAVELVAAADQALMFAKGSGVFDSPQARR